MFGAYHKHHADHHAGVVVIRVYGPLEPRTWQALRQRVWERDDETCQVCHHQIDESDYECGHIVDRCRGGKDKLSNLVVMCISCNRLKPTHDTREAFEAWASSSGSPASSFLLDPQEHDHLRKLGVQQSTIDRIIAMGRVAAR